MCQGSAEERSTYGPTYGRAREGASTAPPAAAPAGTPEPAAPSSASSVATTVSATSRLRFVRSLPRVFAGTHVRQPSVAVRPAVRVEVDADRPFRVFADGDPVAVLPCTITVRPGALRVLLPR